jgi:hypothetical protein
VEPTKGKELFSDRRGHSLARERLARTLSFEVISDCFSFPKPPNKAPEPTPTAVTPRALEMMTEVKQWICSRDEARGAPAAVVAHLYQNVGGSRITDKISGSDL